MQRAHKIRLNPSAEQEKYLRQACGVARFVFNWGLAEWRRQYEADEEPSAYKLKKQLNAVKRQEFPWMYDVTKCAVDTGFRNIDAAFKGVGCTVEVLEQVEGKSEHEELVEDILTIEG